MHAARSFRQWRGQRRDATEAQSQLACLKMTSRLGAKRLARINGIAEAGSTEIAGQSFVEPCNALLAMGAMHPGPLAAEMQPCP